jgi:hypothetical protein
MFSFPLSQAERRFFQQSGLGKADVLLQVADPVVVRDRDRPPVRFHFPDDQTEKGRFSRAVAANKAAPLRPLQREGDVFKKKLPSKRKADII